MLTSSKIIGLSGLNFISKTTKHVVAMQLKHHLTVNKLDNINQSAYKTSHSTETARLTITDDVKLNLAQNKPIDVVLLDLWAAFDTIDHQMANELSSQFGFSGCVHNWFGGFISNKNQSVKSFRFSLILNLWFLVCHRAWLWGPCFSQCISQQIAQ